MAQFTLTDHARRRLNARRIPLDAIDFVFRYGRELPSRGAVLHVLGRRELELFRKDGVKVDRYEGIHVVASEEGVIITAYRNHSPRRTSPGWQRRPVQLHQLAGRNRESRGRSLG